MDSATPPIARGELATLRLFQGVELDEETVELIGTCPLRTLDSGERLIAKGQHNASLYLVLSGRLGVYLSGGAEDMPVAVIEAGGCVGEVSVIEGKPTSAFVIGQAPARLLQMDEQILWHLAESVSGVRQNLLRLLCERVRSANDVINSEREKLTEYRFHATVDGLTGLFNRYWLNQMLPRQMDQSQKQGEPLSLVMIDIDHFKPYNDSHGHVAGDRALCAVAGALRENLRPADMAARYGGEEFLVLLPDSTVADAQVVAERLRRAVERTRILYSEGIELPPVTVSIGVAALPDAIEPDQFLAIADAALYRAKHAGRNTVTT